MKCDNCERNFEGEHTICPYCAKIVGDPQILETNEKISEDMINLSKKYLDKFYTKYKGTKLFVMENLATAILWTGLTLYQFQANYGTKSAKLSTLVIKRGFTDKNHIFDFGKNQDLMIREASITLFMFQIENFLKQINLILENKFDDKGYSGLLKHVLREVGLNDSELKNYNSLYLPSVVRNSLHYAGIHTDNDTEGKIEDIQFKFKKGKKVIYGSWYHTYFFFENMIVTVEKILASPKIINKELQKLEESENN
ncbi:MAG: hypothetical protein KGZ37_04315 [Nitrosarchaeum sp.]|nr:hypothetical protein [Nitrosarchaeum sp.]